ncbi:hypothetical protein GS582_34750 [Rhodococcus hoagii]|nr:hypothetical protein [Prescottella equi]
MVRGDVLRARLRVAEGSTSTYSDGSSTLRDHSYQRFPVSERVASVKSFVMESQSPDVRGGP